MRQKASTEIKKQIAEQNPVTREEVEKIVSGQLSKLQIELLRLTVISRHDGSYSST